jgi:two-component system CheB/CheR fusion protein
VIDTNTPFERDVRDDRGNWYFLRVRPYKNAEDRIAGAVLALVDMQPTKGRSAVDRSARSLAEAVTHMVRQPLVLLDGAGRVTSVNRAFRDVFALSEDAIEGKSLLELSDGVWDTAAFREGLEATLRSDGRRETVELHHDFRSIGTRTLRLLARRAEDGADGTVIVVTVEDVPGSTG